jgi:hypothetical protein
MLFMTFKIGSDYCYYLSEEMGGLKTKYDVYQNKGKIHLKCTKRMRKISRITNSSFVHSCKHISWIFNI